MPETTTRRPGFKSTRRALWIASLLLVPVPLWVFAEAFVPTARLLELGTVVLITIAVEGPAGVAPLVLALFFGHAAVYTALLWVCSWIFCATIDRIYRPALTPLCTILILGGIVWALSSPVYTTPFHPDLPRSTLWEVYQ